MQQDDRPKKKSTERSRQSSGNNGVLSSAQSGPSSTGAASVPSSTAASTALTHPVTRASSSQRNSSSDSPPANDPDVAQDNGAESDVQFLELHAEGSHAVHSRPSTGPSTGSRPRTRGGSSDPLLVQQEANNSQGLPKPLSEEEEDALFESQIPDLITKIMGDEESYGFIPFGSQFESVSSAGTAQDEKSQDGGLVRFRAVAKPVGKLAAALKTPERSATDDQLTEALTSQEGNVPVEVNRLKSAEADVAEGTLHTFLLYLHDLCVRLSLKLLPRFLHGERKQKQIVSILMTPVKRLEREASKSSKRVHFKLRKKSESQQFNPFQKHSAKIQNWYAFMLLPRLWDIGTFGLRLGFVELLQRERVTANGTEITRQHEWVWYTDLVADIFVVANIMVTLVTVVPKDTYPGQTHEVHNLKDIAMLYLKHQLFWEISPGILYHICSIVFFFLPNTDFHTKHASTYLYVWWACMTPRFIANVRALLNYKSVSVVNPNIIRNVKQYKAIELVVILTFSAHLIGCLYYTLARVREFDQTTWIHAFERTLPYYKHKDAEFGSEYLLCIFKGFCRVASLGYDPGLPGNELEMIVAIIVMMLSVFISSLILGTLLTYVVRADPAEVAHKERLEGLRLYMDKKHVTEDLLELVLRYCEFQFKKGRQTSSSSDNDLVHSLSRSLRVEVANAYHKELIAKCSKIGRPFHRCGQPFFNELVVKLYTVHVMPGDHVVHKDEIPRELYFVSSGSVQVVDDHDQVISVIRSDVPDTAPIVGEVPFFLGINYMRAIKASLEGDVQLQVLSKQDLQELIEQYPDDHSTICENLWVQFGGGLDGKSNKDQAEDNLNLDQEKLMTKKRILESQNFRKMQQFNALCKAARSGDVDGVLTLARQGANLNYKDYDGRTAMHMACSQGRYKIVECLLKLGADETIKDRWGHTPMGIAIAGKQQMVITVLAAIKNTKLDIADPELALCTAAGAGDLAQVKRFIDFGVPANLGDYDRRYALHVAAAEGHEKIVEFLLLAQADPNCKDRWGGTPLQDALSGGHISTAYMLKAKGAEVPESFGAGAVCEAAGKGDVPKLRMLHSFGQSLDVGDYDDRYALHLASAEGRVLAVSFLLGISSDPNVEDRWNGTPMDDCVRGGTLYHKYCAKLLQGWGGELGTFKNTKEGTAFLSALEHVSISNIREVIRKLIDQGLDKECPERMDDQQLLVVMTATARHMPLVTQLHTNTSVITREIMHFKTIVYTFVAQIRDHLESVMLTLSKGSRRVPEYELSSIEDIQRTRRPKTAKMGAATRAELNHKIDLFTGIEQEDNSRVTDSLVLESPTHSHRVVGPPKRMKHWYKTGQTDIVSPEKWIGNGTETVEQDGSGDLGMTQKGGAGRKPTLVFKQQQSRSTASIFKRNNQRSEALVRTLFDFTIPPFALQDCFEMLKKRDKKRFLWMTEAAEGFLDSDEEDALHGEVDGMNRFQDNLDQKRSEMWWEKHAARLFNQLALTIVDVESSFKLLHQILIASLPQNLRPDADPLLVMETLSRALVALRTNTSQLDLDKMVEEVHLAIKPFRLLLTPKERRANKDEPSGQVRFSTLVAASSAFKDAILNMDVNKTLCDLMKSRLSYFFNEAQADILLLNSRRVTFKEKDRLFNLNAPRDVGHKYLTLVFSGEITVIRTLDDVEISRGKCTVGCFFGSFTALENNLDFKELSEEEKETHVKEGGNGVNNCVMKAATACEVLLIPISNLREVLPMISEAKTELFLSKNLERIAGDVLNLDNLNGLVMEINSSNDTNWNTQAVVEEWMLPVSKRKHYNLVPELERQSIQDSFLSIHNLWIHLSRGAKSVPKGTVDMIKEFLGESGSQCYDNVFAPMEMQTAPEFFNAETFWFCWIKFLHNYIAHASHDGRKDHEGDFNEDQDAEMKDEKDLTTFKGVLTFTANHATKLAPMDTFTGKADPYLSVTVDGVTQKTQVKTATLEPIWNEVMKFNAIANRSIVRVEVFDSESMGQDRTMGTFCFVLSQDQQAQRVSHKLEGVLADGRTVQGTVHCSCSFLRGARTKAVVEQKSEFQLFCETENYQQRLLWFISPSRRIESAFFKVSLPVHEREFTKAVGTLAVPLTGLAIKQYLTYLLVEHQHQVDVYSCREFCGFFKRKLDEETSIAYRDIVKIVKERNSGLNSNELFIGTTLNRYHWLLRAWYFLVKVVSLFHLVMVPLRIGFRPWSNRPETKENGMLNSIAVGFDFPSDLILFLHVILLLNQAYQNSKSQWVTNRWRIFKNMDWCVVLAAVPLDWIVFLSGMNADSAVWCRLNKLVLIFSRIHPFSLVLSTRGSSIQDLFAQFVLLWHYCACIYFYLGDMVPELMGADTGWGKHNQISWLHDDRTGHSVQIFERSRMLGTKPGATMWDQYLMCLYWVLSTISCQGVVADVVPQNFMEIMYAIALLAINLTMYRWISGEIANIVMSSDDRVIRTREEQDRILKFVSVKAFTGDLRNRIQSHFLAVQGNTLGEQDKVLQTLSHGLRVQLARLIWRDFLAKVHLFRGCSGQFVDAVCVLVQERHFGPEQMVGIAGSVTNALFVLVHGALESYTEKSSKIKKISRKGGPVGILSFFFGVKQHMTTRAARSGAVCIGLPREGMMEVLQTYPKDEERVHVNALNFFSKDKQSEGSVAFSAASGSSMDSGDSDSDDSRSSRGTTKSGGTSKTGSTDRTSGSGHSHDTRGSGNTKSSKDTTSEKSSRRKKGKKSKSENVAGKFGQVQSKELADNLGLDNLVSDAGGASSIDDGDDAGAPAAVAVLEEDDMPLMKEVDHIPMVTHTHEIDRLNAN